MALAVVEGGWGWAVGLTAAVLVELAALASEV